LVDADLKLLSWPGNSTYGSTGSYAYRTDDGNKYNNGSGSSYGSTVATGDVIGIAYDGDNGALYFSKNGTWQNSGDPTSGVSATGAAFTGLGNQTWTIACGNAGGSTNGTATNFNFGQREFAYPPGTASATDYFNTVTYTGNGSTQSITGVGFQPDFVWCKARNSTSSHTLTDSVRGADRQLWSNLTTAEQTNSTDFITSFDSDGFTSGPSASGTGSTNENNGSFVAWCWKAGGTASDNTDGNVTSSVSVNQDAGFSVVKYTSSTSTKPLNVGHGLGKKPDFILTKNLDATSSWGGYHSSVGATKSMFINTVGSGTVSADYFNDTEPTTSVFTVNDSNNTHSYGTTNEFIAYCWTAKDGVSKFGSYTGNGSSTGPFVECGFKPRMVIVKRTDANSNWFMYDTIRGTNNKLYAEGNYDENGEDGGSTTSNTILSLSTGFQMTSGNGSNTNGGTYIFMAWAENFSADADFKSLNTANLPAPTVKDGSQYFNTILWAGNNANPRTLSGVGFQPDWVWLKDRTQTTNHRLVDSVRGAGNTLKSNLTSAETSSEVAGTITAFTSDGFTVEGTSNVEGVNLSGDNFVAWNWKANGTGSSNTDGSITSTVSANPTAGFSIVTYSGQTTNFTWGHGLGVPPSMVIIKRRNTAAGWSVYHKSLGATKRLQLDQTGGEETMSYFQNAEPTDTVFSVTTNGGVGADGDTYVAYCFAEVEGYSKFGSYTGNGSTDGPFVYCGFSVQWLMYKRSNAAEDWVIVDNSRDTYNVADAALRPNRDLAEFSNNEVLVDFTSNGFKIRSSDAKSNGSGSTYIFMALAENPFGGDGVSPATAR
jgi:hypothetical protein